MKGEQGSVQTCVPPQHVCRSPAPSVLTVQPKHLAPRGRVPVSVSEPGHPSAFCFPHWVPSETVTGTGQRLTGPFDILWGSVVWVYMFVKTY